MLHKPKVVKNLKYVDLALKKKRAKKKLTALKKNDCMFIKHSALFRHLIKPFIASSVSPRTF